MKMKPGSRIVNFSLATLWKNERGIEVEPSVREIVELNRGITIRHENVQKPKDWIIRWDFWDMEVILNDDSSNSGEKNRAKW